MTEAHKTERVEFAETEFLAGDLDSSSWYDHMKVGGAFDGISCPDQHRVVNSTSQDSYIEATTDYGLFGADDPVDVQLTVEFWLKLSRGLWDSPDMPGKMIFSMVAVDRDGEIYPGETD